ncbi:acetate--CoA ligase family protein [Microvirga sp. VF16]|uniref:acetate--CoA ligase family protein n=1 Tax=Microvirga sp. VF16 TaxID=2807101 RepID=UPI00193D51FC|nr:acetate--CoA ligase family protein [Microvirga sp. VF16]QRM29236.1 acetate--CoA ligase family protein [Microvirga sp. VF16]
MANPNSWWQAVLQPRCVAVIGASNSPDKVGGRPLRYMQRFGFNGRIFPINPTRSEVQGIKAFSSLREVPDRPELAIVAVPAANALSAVQACAERGVEVVVVLTSGFGETGPEGRAVQDSIVATARRAGMRIIGPNTQGVANFGNGTIASFATLFSEIEPSDGPVGIVSQSGAMSVVPYAHLRRAGIGVRYAHATGNEADVTVADLAASVLDDSSIRLLLLYMESIQNPAALAAVAMRAHARGVPVLALKSGRSTRGAAAASSHTGALLSEDRVVDAFLRQHGILRVDDMHGLVNAADLFLSGKRSRGRRLAVVSNSGASCVMAADLAEAHGLDMPDVKGPTRAALAAVLPSFATPSNPLDLTGALLSQSGLFGQALDVLARSDFADQMMISLPNAGAGYDVPGFVEAARSYSHRTGAAVAVVTPNPSTADAFRKGGIAAFDHDSHAIAALAQLARWNQLEAGSASPVMIEDIKLPLLPTEVPYGQVYASEWASLSLLQACGLPTPRMRLCHTPDEGRRAFAGLKAPLVIKGCSPDVPHKSEYGLVRLGIATSDEAAQVTQAMQQRMKDLGVRSEGVILAEMKKADVELLLGGRYDPKFGPVITVGAGGKYVEALDDVAVLLAPFSRAAAKASLQSLRMAPLFGALRGDPAIDVDGVVDMMLRLAAIMLRAGPAIASIDLNPVLAERGGAVVVADALIEYAEGQQ